MPFVAAQITASASIRSFQGLLKPPLEPEVMSFCTLHRQVRSNAVALCGLYQGPLDTYLRENPHLKRIVLCLDADGPGREATKKFQAEYAEKGYTVFVRAPAQGKDWNECLLLRGRTRERGK